MRQSIFGRPPTSRAGLLVARRISPLRTSSKDAAKAMIAIGALYLVFLGVILAFTHGIPALLGQG